MLGVVWLIVLLGGVGLFVYGAVRFFRGDWSASSIEDRPEDSAYDDDDLDDADIDPVDDEDEYDDEEPWR